MKKMQLGMIFFWVAVMGLKVWAGFHGQTSQAESITEILGFLFLLAGSLLIVSFNRLHHLRAEKLGRAAVNNIDQENFLALLFQGLLLIGAGTLMLFLKWWLASAIAGLFAGGIIALFFKGWPHWKINFPHSGTTPVNGTHRFVSK